MRIPGPLQLPLLLLLLILIHQIAPIREEQLRVRVLGTLTTPVPVSTSDEESTESGLSTLEQEIRTRVLTHDAEGTTTRLQGAYPVLDFEAERGFLIVGAGSASGVQVGTRLLAGETVCAIVDRVTEHLARGRLLTTRGLELPVEVVHEGQQAPGGLDRLFAIMRGTGESAVLTESHLPDQLRAGLAVVTPRQNGSPPPLAVGHLAGGGARPTVALDAEPESYPWVIIEGLPADLAREDLYEEESFEVEWAPNGSGHGSLISGDAAHRLTPGMAVQSQGRYLGRVTTTSGNRIHVARPEDMGERTLVEVHGVAQTGTLVELLGAGGLAVPSPAIEHGDSHLVLVTRGGQELIPRGLVVLHLPLGDGSLRKLPVRRLWPRTVQVSVFRFPEERRQLRLLR